VEPGDRASIETPDSGVAGDDSEAESDESSLSTSLNSTSDNPSGSAGHAEYPPLTEVLQPQIPGCACSATVSAVCNCSNQCPCSNCTGSECYLGNSTTSDVTKKVGTEDAQTSDENRRKKPVNMKVENGVIFSIN